MSSQPEELLKTLAHHDAAIVTLGGQMKTLQGEVHSGFASINSTLLTMNSKLDKQEARPTFNIHETIRTVQSIGLTVGLIVGGIIWIVNGSFSGMVAEQKALNQSVVERLKEHQSDINKLADRTQWLPSAPKRN